MVSGDRWVPHNSIGSRDEAASSWLTIKASGVARTRLPQKNKIVLLSRHVKLFHDGIQQLLGGFATRDIRVEQIIDMSDREKCEPTIELIEIESLFQSTLMDSKFVRKSVSEVLIPGATCVASSIDTPSSHAHFSRFTSWWRMPFWHPEQEQSFYSSCLQVCM